jgi:hypothetical protein
LFLDPLKQERDFFKNEFEYLSSFDPTYSGLKAEYYQALLESSWRNQLEEKWGKQLFTLTSSNETGFHIWLRLWVVVYSPCFTCIVNFRQGVGNFGKQSDNKEK